MVTRAADYLDHDIPGLMAKLGARKGGHVHIELCPYASAGDLGVGTLGVLIFEQDHDVDDDPLEGRFFPLATWAPDLLGYCLHASLAVMLLEDDQRISRPA